MNPYSNCPQSERIEDEEVNVEICYVYILVVGGKASIEKLIHLIRKCASGLYSRNFV